MDNDKHPSPGSLWRPGSSPQDNPLHIVVAVLIGLIMIGVRESDERAQLCR